jgi:hypothetical protein
MTTISIGVVFDVKGMVIVRIFLVVIESIVVGVNQWMVVIIMMNITTRMISTTTIVENVDRKRNVHLIKVMNAAVLKAIITINVGTPRILNIVQTRVDGEVVKIRMMMWMLYRPATIASITIVSRPIGIKKLMIQMIKTRNLRSTVVVTVIRDAARKIVTVARVIVIVMAVGNRMNCKWMATIVEVQMIDFSVVLATVTQNGVKEIDIADHQIRL